MSTRYRTLLALGSGYLPETQAIIDRAITEGFAIPSTATLDYINNLIAVMKTDGYWVKRDNIFNFAYNDLTCADFARINWKNPTGALATKTDRANLIVASEVFDTSAWAKVTSPSVTDNAITVLGGTLPMAKYYGTGSTSRIQRTMASVFPSAYNVPMVFSIFAKADELDNLRLGFDGNIGNYDLTNEIASVFSGDITVGMEEVEAGLFRCYISKADWGVSTIQIYTNPRFDGSNGGLYVGGAQLETGSVPSPYVKTTTANDSGQLVYNQLGYKGAQTASNTCHLELGFDLDSGSAQYTLTNAGRDVVVANSVANAMVDGSASFRDYIRQSNSTAQRIASNTNNLNSAVNLNADGYLALNRTSSTDVEVFTRATQFSRTQNNGTISTQPQRTHYGQYLGGGSNISWYSTGAEVVTEGQLFRTAYNAYLTNIGLSAIA